MMLSLLQTGLMHKINLRAYLIDYLRARTAHGRQAPKDLDCWRPWNYRPKERALGP